MKKQTLYQRATAELQRLIRHLLRLSDRTQNFVAPPDEIWKDKPSATLLLVGRGYLASEVPPPKRRKGAWLARSAVQFNLAQAATELLYNRLQPFIGDLIENAYQETDNFMAVTQEWVRLNPHFLPVMMHASGVFSKQELIRRFGNISDTRISGPASERISKWLNGIETGRIARKDQVIERFRTTAEGIVRDLIGRLLLEEFVANALVKSGVPFRRESEYSALTGVVYDFRADFVVPDESQPRAFLEIRKSTSRHASLYAKDKMFSAINWKGKHPECLGVLVVDGPWTRTTLGVLAQVFDYVVPIENAAEIATIIRRYIEGDKKILRRLIHFRIEQQ